MIIAHRLSGMGWMPENRMTLDDLFDPDQWYKALFVARNQEEYDMLRGYELAYGRELPLRMVDDTRLQFNILNVSFFYEVFLWVDFPVESN